MKKYYVVIVIIILITLWISDLKVSKGNETLPGSFTVLEDDPTPVIRDLGLYRANGQMIFPNSGSIVPNTRHSIRFNVSNDFFSLSTFEVRVALFKSENGTIADFLNAKTNPLGEAFVMAFTNNSAINILYESNVSSEDHSFDDKFFNDNLHIYQINDVVNSFDFELYFNMSKVVSFNQNYFIGVEFTQTIENRQYKTIDIQGFYRPNAYTEISLALTNLQWELNENQSFESYDYQSDASREIIPTSSINYISNASFDIEMSSDAKWAGQDLDDPLNIDARVEAFLSQNPVTNQTFGLKVNTAGIPNTGVQISTNFQRIHTLNATNEYGSFGLNIYVFLGILGNNFQNGQYNGNLYISFTQ